MIIEQRGGVITEDGEHVATIPRGASMLAFAGKIRACGEEFREDGYVYLDGARRRKWFRDEESIGRVWMPGLDLARVEDLRWRLTVRAQAYRDRVVMPIVRELHAHGKPVFAAPSVRSGWFEYSPSGETYCVGRSDEGESSDLGTRMRAASCGNHARWCRAVRAQRGVELAAHVALADVAKSTARLDVNGRTYWLESKPNRWGGRERWRITSLPEDQTVHVATYGKRDRRPEEKT